MTKDRMTAAELQAHVKAKKRNELEDILAEQLTNVEIPFERQYKFHPEKNWRADFSIFDRDYPKMKLLLECDGGTFSKPKLKIAKSGKPYMTKSAHSSGTGIASDMLRQNEAVILGYRVLRFDTNMVKNGTALTTILRALGIGNNKQFKAGKGLR